VNTEKEKEGIKLKILSVFARCINSLLEITGSQYIYIIYEYEVGAGIAQWYSSGLRAG
jgi:hypothetical protein